VRWADQARRWWPSRACVCCRGLSASSVLDHQAVCRGLSWSSAWDRLGRGVAGVPACLGGSLTPAGPNAALHLRRGHRPGPQPPSPTPRRQVPGRAGGYPPGPPTDPYVRHARIRFLRQSGCYPAQSSGFPWSGLVSAKSLPCLLPADALPGGRLPSRGSLGSHFPTFAGTLRRYDCHPAHLGVLHVSLVPRYLACFRRSWCP
jgi:hypothetical protein